MGHKRIQNIGIEPGRAVLGDLARAARDQGSITVITDRGVAVAAIVPLELVQAELYGDSLDRIAGKNTAE